MAKRRTVSEVVGAPGVTEVVLRAAAPQTFGLPSAAAATVSEEGGRAPRARARRKQAPAPAAEAAVAPPPAKSSLRSATPRKPRKKVDAAVTRDGAAEAAPKRCSSRRQRAAASASDADRGPDSRGAEGQAGSGDAGG
jgi:hypothetical protein